MDFINKKLIKLKTFAFFITASLFSEATTILTQHGLVT